MGRLAKAVGLEETLGSLPIPGMAPLARNRSQMEFLKIVRLPPLLGVSTELVEGDPKDTPLSSAGAGLWVLDGDVLDGDLE